MNDVLFLVLNPNGLSKQVESEVSNLYLNPLAKVIFGLVVLPPKTYSLNTTVTIIGWKGSGETPVNPDPSPTNDPDMLEPETLKDPVITALPEKGNPAPLPPPEDDPVSTVNADVLPFAWVNVIVFLDTEALVKKLDVNEFIEPDIALASCADEDTVPWGIILVNFDPSPVKDLVKLPDA